MASNISQNTPFGNRPNSRSRIGPSYFNWCPPGSGKNNTCVNGIASSDKYGMKRRGVGLTGTITPPPDMVYSSTIVESVTESCFEFQSELQVILKIKITTTGSNHPISIDKFNLQVAGFPLISNLLVSPYNTKIYYTGNNNNYSSGNLFGSANFGGLSKLAQITGTQDLLEGDNYFWVVYKEFTTLNTACISEPFPDCFNCSVSFTTDLKSISINQEQIVLTLDPIAGCLSCANMTFLSASGTITDTCLNIGDVTAVVLQINIETSGVVNPLNVTGFPVTNNFYYNLVSPYFVTIHYTGADPNFSYNPIGMDVFGSYPSNLSYAFVSCFAPQPLLEGNNYFWVTYDINTDIVNCDQFVDCDITNVVMADKTYDVLSNGTHVCIDTPCMGLLGSVYVNAAEDFSVSCNYNAYPNSIAAPILRIQVTTTGSTDPLIVTKFGLLASGTTDVNTDLVAGTMYYSYSADTWTGIDYPSSPVVTLGSFTSSFGSSPYPFDIDVNQALIEGNNYFWLAYEVGLSPNCGVDNLGGNLDYMILTSTTINTVVSEASGLLNHINPPYVNTINCDVPMGYVSSEYSHVGGTVTPSTESPYTITPILKIKITTSGNTSPISVTWFELSTVGTTDDGSILSAKIYYTGCDSEFNTNYLIGTYSSPTGLYSINVNQPLNEFDNYFWIAYEIAPWVCPGYDFYVYDGTTTSLEVNSIIYLPPPVGPVGTVAIVCN